MSDLSLLERALAIAPSNTFQDTDGLISFVNLSSSYVVNSSEFKIGQRVCDKISNFFASLRLNVFAAMLKDKVPPLAGDAKPHTQWDAAVTNFMFHICQEAGGFTNFSVTEEKFSKSQVVQEFSTDFIKMIFDAAVVPDAIIKDVTSFVQSVGATLRASWDDKQRTFSHVLMGQCHEAIPIDNSGKHFRYYPKIKIFHVEMNSSQQEFKTSCSRTKVLNFDFNYSYYVTGLDADLLSADSVLYDSFVNGFLGKAQGANNKDANSKLDSVIPDTSSSSPAKHIAGGGSTMTLEKYPLINI